MSIMKAQTQVPQIDEIYLQKVINEITSYLSPEVNFLEAAGIFIAKHDIDAETFAMLAHQHPVLWSNIYECALKQKRLKVSHAILPFF